MSASILIVEDDLLIARMVQRKLQNAGYAAPSIATSEGEAMRLMTQQRPDLILMDIQLDGSGLDGIEIAKRIRSQADVPIIYLTANIGDEIVQRAKVTEPYGYLLKPFRDRELFSTIEIALYKHQLEQRLRESEVKMHSIFSAAPIGIGVVVNRVIVEANDRLCEMTGYDRAELVGQSARLLYPTQKDYDYVGQEKYRQITERGSGSVETRWQRKDGVILDILLSSTPLNHTDLTAGVTFTALDITQRKQAELRMRILTEMLDVAPNSITVHDWNGRFLYANQKTFALHQYSPDEFMTINLHQLDVPASAAQIEPRMRQIAETGESAFEVEHFRRDGSTIPLEIFVKAVDWMGQPAMLSIATDITQRKQAERERDLLLAQIQTQAQQLGDVLDAVPEGVLLLDAHSRIVLANLAAQKDLALLTDAHPGQVLTELGCLPLDHWLTWPQDPSWHEIKVEDRSFEVIGRPIHLGLQDMGWVLVLRDMTREHQMQDRLRQQDRLSVIGQLAGGVAHDFNNLLMAIKGYTEFAIEELPPDNAILTDLEEVRRAADRAAALTNQLLIFSRKQALRPRALDMNEVIHEMEKMLRRLIGENICLQVSLDHHLGQILADRGQIEQMVMNLCVNARDAMPQGGTLYISTQHLVLADADRDVPPGEYALLSVADTGIGMTEHVQAHLFEPFFTTKEAGKGTGLGLSTVWAIVQQSRGYIHATSQPGQGATFQIYLPCIESPLDESPSNDAEQFALRGNETILLVEDDEAVRTLARRVLQQYGYKVLTAGRPGEAIQLYQQHADAIALLISDVIMPEMNGRQLAETLQADQPRLRVLYISGYTDDQIAQHGILQPGLDLLEKPFTSDKLARRVREILDRPPNQP